MDMWSPYKELLNTVEAVIARPSSSVSPNFIQLLKKHKQNFITLLKNPVSYPLRLLVVFVYTKISYSRKTLKAGKSSKKVLRME